MSNELDRLGDEDEKKKMNTMTMINTPPRYLPVTRQEGFDLRGHIESAGHQVNLLVDEGFSMQLHTGVQKQN